MVERREPGLFRAYAGLMGKVPWVSLTIGPTPVERLDGLSAAIGGPDIWVKRDDLTSPAYGGNKTRRLQFILADALKRGKSTVVTSGPIGTNHGLATTIFASRLGLKTVLLLFDQPLTRHVQEHLRLLHHFGAEMVYVRTPRMRLLHRYLVERVRRPRAYFVWAGGSTPAGVVGFVEAALELKEQIDQGVVPEPKRIYVPVGAGGTLAGLLLGARLAGLRSRLIGVRVTPRGIANARTTDRCCSGIRSIRRICRLWLRRSIIVACRRRSIGSSKRRLASDRRLRGLKRAVYHGLGGRLNSSVGGTVQERTRGAGVGSGWDASGGSGAVGEAVADAALFEALKPLTVWAVRPLQRLGHFGRE